MEEPAANNNSRHWPSSIEPSSSRSTRNGCTIPLNLEIETTESLTAVAGHVCVAYRGCLICWGGYCYDEREIHYRECNWLYIFPYMLCGAQNNVWLKVQCETDLQLRPNSGATAAVWRDQLFIFGGCLFDEIHKRMVNTSMLLAIDLRTGVLAAKNYPPDERIPTPRDKTTSWIANNNFYVFGGYGMSWHRLDHSKHKYFFQPQSFLDDDMGSCWNNQLLFYDIRKECWSEVDQRGKKPSQRAAAASIFVADLNRAFLFGGRHDQNRLNDLYMLDMVSMIWTQIDHPCHTPTPPNSPAQNLPEGRSWCTMTLLAAEKKILCYGGLCSRGQPLSDLWELDISKFYAQQQQQPTEHSKVVEVLERPHWKQVPPLDHQLPPRLWHCAVLMGSEAILLYGGMNEPPSRDSPFVRTLLVQRLQPPSLGQLTLCQLAEGIVDRWMAQMNSEKASANSSSSGYRLQLPSAVQAMDNGHLDLQCFASAAGFMAGLPKSLHPHLRMLLSICKHAKALNPAGGNTPRGTSPSRRWQSLPAAPLNFHNFHLLNLDGMVDGGGDSEDEENYQVDRHHLRLGRRSHWNVPLSPKSQKRALADEIVKQVCENGRARSIPFMQALFNAFDAFC